MKDNLDNLHAVVTAARARKEAGYDGKDVWRDDLQPRAAVRARTIPLLEEERNRLHAELAQVVFELPTRCSCVILTVARIKLTQENSELQSEIQRNVQTKEEADKDAARLLDVLDKV